MKLLLSSLQKSVLIALACAFCYAQSAVAQNSAPAFEDENAIVIDIQSVRGRAKDEIRVINATHEADIDAEIYVYEKRNGRWRNYGTASLSGINDTDRVTSLYSGNLGRFSHIAVLTTAQEPVKVAVKKAHNDIYIYLFSDFSLNTDGLSIIDSKSVRGSFRDNIKVRNFSDTLENISFTVFARKTEADPWILAGTVYLKGKGDTDTLETPLSKISSYRYFTLAAEDGATFTLDAEKMNNDLYIYIED